METQVKDQTTSTIQQLELIRGKFSPTESSELLKALFEQKINFHKIKRLQEWEGNHDSETAPFKERIHELETSLSKAQEFISEHQDSENTISINAVIVLTVHEAGQKQ